MIVAELRQQYLEQICRDIIRIRTNQGREYPNFADGSSAGSSNIAWAMVKQFDCELNYIAINGQTTGTLFELATRDFLKAVFEKLQHLRPGRWIYTTEHTEISRFDQYAHLAQLKNILATNKELAAALGGDYLVTPDIVVARYPVVDSDINAPEHLVDEAQTAQLTPLRRANHRTEQLLLHASISCKWTIRSDRSQNMRTEALNLIRNRKGQTPHIVAVAAEPLPTRLAALALGTGDLDCVYHFALPELIQAVESINNPDQLDMLNTLLQGRRLRDIADLPFDLAI
ncbi:NgoMIV family type II restriction endonuclease [Chloroflexota bacterium]